MLDGSRDSSSYIKVGTYHPTGLPHLVLMIDPAGIDSRARSTDGPADRVCAVADQREVRRSLQTAAARHDDVCFRDRQFARFRRSSFQALRFGLNPTNHVTNDVRPPAAR